MSSPQCRECGNKISLFRKLFKINNRFYYICSRRCWISNDLKMIINGNFRTFLISEIKENMDEKIKEIQEDLKGYIYSPLILRVNDLIDNKMKEYLKYTQEDKVKNTSTRKEVLPSRVCPQCQKEIKKTKKQTICCSRSCARKRFNSLNKIHYIKRENPLPAQSKLNFMGNNGL